MGSLRSTATAANMLGAIVRSSIRVPNEASQPKQAPSIPTVYNVRPSSNHFICRMGRMCPINVLRSVNDLVLYISKLMPYAHANRSPPDEKANSRQFLRGMDRYSVPYQKKRGKEEEEKHRKEGETI